jgi:hypothetical protein
VLGVFSGSPEFSAEVERVLPREPVEEFLARPGDGLAEVGEDSGSDSAWVDPLSVIFGTRARIRSIAARV